jgi:hypothetical protein
VLRISRGCSNSNLKARAWSGPVRSNFCRGQALRWSLEMVPDHAGGSNHASGSIGARDTRNTAALGAAHKAAMLDRAGVLSRTSTPNRPCRTAQSLGPGSGHCVRACPPCGVCPSCGACPSLRCVRGRAGRALRTPGASVVARASARALPQRAFGIRIPHCRQQFGTRGRQMSQYNDWR